MEDKKVSQRLQEKFQKLQEATGAITAGALLGAGIGGAAKLAGKEASMLKGGLKGAYAGMVAELLLLGGAGVAQLIRRAREKGANETKSSIRKAVSRAQDSNKLTNTQKAQIRNNGQVAIAKIDQVYKTQKKHESFEGEKVKDTEEKQYESLGKSLLERLDRISEEATAKKSAAAGAIAGAVAGHKLNKHQKRTAVKNAVTVRKQASDKLAKAAAETTAAKNKAKAAKTIYNKETRTATQLAKKNPTGMIDKLKNHAAKLNQAGRVKAAEKTLNQHPNVAKALSKEAAAAKEFKSANKALAGAKKALRGVGKFGGAGKGALVGAALGAGAYALAKRANQNK